MLQFREDRSEFGDSGPKTPKFKPTLPSFFAR